MPESNSIFISHHHSPIEDAFTARLKADLRVAGADVWVDDEAITMDNFVGKINEGLAGRQWLILVMTPEALRSSWVRDEVNSAIHQVRLGRMRAVIPFQAIACDEAEIPPLWSALQRYDATRDYDQALAGLLHAIGLPSLSAQAPAPSQPAPIAPTASPYVAVAAPAPISGAPTRSAPLPGIPAAPMAAAGAPPLPHYAQYTPVMPGAIPGQRASSTAPRRRLSPLMYALMLGGGIGIVTLILWAVAIGNSSRYSSFASVMAIVGLIITIASLPIAGFQIARRTGTARLALLAGLVAGVLAAIGVLIGDAMWRRGELTSCLDTVGSGYAGDCSSWSTTFSSSDWPIILVGMIIIVGLAGAGSLIGRAIMRRRARAAAIQK